MSSSCGRKAEREGEREREHELEEATVALCDHLRSRHHRQNPNTRCEHHHPPNPLAYRMRTATAESWCCCPLPPPMRWAWAWTRQSRRNRTRRSHDLYAQPIDTACPGTGSGTRTRAANSPPDVSPGQGHAPMRPYPDASPSVASRQALRALCHSAHRTL